MYEKRAQYSTSHHITSQHRDTHHRDTHHIRAVRRRSNRCGLRSAPLCFECDARTISYCTCTVHWTGVQYRLALHCTAQRSNIGWNARGGRWTAMDWTGRLEPKRYGWRSEAMRRGRERSNNQLNSFHHYCYTIALRDEDSTTCASYCTERHLAVSNYRCRTAPASRAEID